LMNLVLALAGVTGDGLEKSKPTPQQIAFPSPNTMTACFGSQLAARLTPETAWNATPNEIAEAYQGRLDMLKAIYGAAKATKRPR